MHALVRASVLAATAASIAFFSPAPATGEMLMASPLWAGTWQLNLAASRLGAPAGQRSETRVYALDGNKLTVTVTGTDAAGKPMQYSYSGAFDGKPYPMLGNPVGDNIALTLVNPRRANATVRMGSMIVATATSEVSADGQHLTLTRKTLHGKAAATIDVLAFDKK